MAGNGGRLVAARVVVNGVMMAEMQEPTEDFVRFFASKVYTGKMTPAAREKFTHITRRALRQFVTDQLNERLKAALGGDSPAVVDTPVPVIAPAAETPVEADGKPITVTTDEEREAFVLYTLAPRMKAALAAYNSNGKG